MESRQSFIFAPDRTIRFVLADPDYTLRLEPGEILRILGETAPRA